VIIPLSIDSKDSCIEINKALPRNLERVVGVSASITTYSTADVDQRNIGKVSFELNNRTIFPGTIPINYYNNLKVKHDNTFSLNEPVGENPRATVRFFNNKNFVDKDGNLINFTINVTLRCINKK
jgi:hypothetical protein